MLKKSASHHFASYGAVTIPPASRARVTRSRPIF